MSVICFLPCRKGSERVPRKNIKPFAGNKFGLVEVKLKQLLSAPSISQVVLSTNDEEIIEYASGLKNSKMVTHMRDDSLSSSATSTDDLVSHALDLIPNAHILWTHVTSPFFQAADYEYAIQKYFSALVSGYDSLMTTSEIHSFLWNEDGPINYDRTKEKWPRTQTIPVIHEINSAAFISHSSNYVAFGDRIGERPFLLPISKIKSFDIDWPEDFSIAESIALSGIAGVK